MCHLCLEEPPTLKERRPKVVLMKAVTSWRRSASGGSGETLEVQHTSVKQAKADPGLVVTLQKMLSLFLFILEMNSGSIHIRHGPVSSFPRRLCR